MTISHLEQEKMAAREEILRRASTGIGIEQLSTNVELWRAAFGLPESHELPQISMELFRLLSLYFTPPIMHTYATVSQGPQRKALLSGVEASTARKAAEALFFCNVMLMVTIIVEREPGAASQFRRILTRLNELANSS